MKKAVRIAVKGIAALLLLVVAYVALVLFVNRQDEPLNPEYTKFMEEHARPVVPENENAFDAYQGFVAPKGKDIAEFGKQMRSPDEKVRSEALNSTISVTTNSTNTSCWLDYQKNEPSSEDCSQMNDEKLLSLVRDDQLFLDRLTSLYRYKYFVPTYPEGEIHGVLSGQDLIVTQRLLMAKLVYDAKHGKAEEAMKAWIANAEFMQRLYAGRSNMTSHAINGVLFREGIRTYPLIAHQLTQRQLAAFQSQLDKIFDAPTFGKGGWDIEGTLVEEAVLLKLMDRYVLDQHKCSLDSLPAHVNTATCEAFLQVYHPGATKNLYMEFLKDTLIISQLPPAKTPEAVKAMTAKYDYKQAKRRLFSSFFYNFAGTLLVGGVSVGENLVPATHAHTARLHMLKLYTDAKVKGVKVDEMPDFIAHSPESLYNPFTNQPFEWDAKTHSLVMPRVDPKESKNPQFTVVY